LDVLQKFDCFFNFSICHLSHPVSFLAVKMNTKTKLILIGIAIVILLLAGTAMTLAIALITHL
jgi:hypothetical protein